MTKAYKYGLQPEDIPLCSTRDGCDHCAQRYAHNNTIDDAYCRLKTIKNFKFVFVIYFISVIVNNRMEFMWNEEVLRNGIKNASLRRVAWKFTRTRVLTGIFLYFLSLIFGFLGPVSV
jgi:hypothetical protein